MTRILIAGGYGYTGRLLAYHLRARSDAEIILAGRHREKAQAYAEELNAEFGGERVSARRVDLASARSLHEALHDVDLLVVAAPTTQHAETVIQAALDADVDYLDVQLGTRKLALLNERTAAIERSGRCFITEAGFHPGLPAALVRYAAAKLDRLDAAIVAGYLNMKDVSYTEGVDELMELFRNYQGQVYKEGRWTKAGTYDVRTVDFGGEVGERRCYSMFLEELRILPDRYPALQEAGFYMAGTHWFVDGVITPLVMLGLKLAPRRGVRPLGKLLWWSMQAFARPPYRVQLKVEASGEKEGVPSTGSVSVAHADGYALTAIPVAACLLQYLDGSARRPGLWMMGHLVEPERLFDDMERMGVRVIVE